MAIRVFLPLFLILCLAWGVELPPRVTGNHETPFENTCSCHTDSKRSDFVSRRDGRHTLESSLGGVLLRSWTLFGRFPL
ncbi:hypothetical protein V8E55_012162 [Tylopilus felleus]